MNYAIILASGKGIRMKDCKNIPKQFREINGKPIIIYTINNLLKVNRFDALYVVVPQDYIDYTKIIINKHIKENLEKINIISGGNERMDSIDNAIKAIVDNNKVNDNDIVVIHDGVRPFITERILNESIDKSREYGAVVASIPVSDTLLISNDGYKVDEIPKRSIYYKGQAPDSFRLKLFIELLEKLSPEDRKKIVGTSQVCTLNNYPIHMIEGDEINFKITTASDLNIANGIAKEIDLND